MFIAILINPLSPFIFLIGAAAATYYLAFCSGNRILTCTLELQLDVGHDVLWKFVGGFIQNLTS